MGEGGLVRGEQQLAQVRDGQSSGQSWIVPGFLEPREAVEIALLKIHRGQPGHGAMTSTGIIEELHGIEHVPNRLFPGR